MKIREIITELELPHHNKPNYTGIGREPRVIKSKYKDYDFSPNTQAVKSKLHMQVDKKLESIANKLVELKHYTNKNDTLYQQILNKEMYIRSAIDA